MQNCKRFLKQEPVFVIAAVCAVVSMLWVPPSAQYLEYIDLRVLELLFCLMAAVAGMQQEGTFLVLSQRMLAGRKSSRLLTLSLVMLPFFASMLITNDVALITFVPFAVLVLQLTNQMQRLAWVVTLQTIAANIGSMLTPGGQSAESVPEQLLRDGCGKLLCRDDSGGSAELLPAGNLLPVGKKQTDRGAL